MEGIDIISGFRLTDKKHLDLRSGPYLSLGDATSAILPLQRFIGLRVDIVTAADELTSYVFKTGIDDSDLEVLTTFVGGDMLKSQYDTDDSGVIDNAEHINGYTVNVNVPANAKFTDTVYVEPAGYNLSSIIGLDIALDDKEDKLYNPAAAGKFLTSSPLGIRSWIIPSLLMLHDTPPSYLDRYGQVLAVNIEENGLELVPNITQVEALPKMSVVLETSLLPTRAELIAAFKLLPPATSWAENIEFFIEDSANVRIVSVKYRSIGALNEASAGKFFYALYDEAI